MGVRVKQERGIVSNTDTGGRKAFRIFSAVFWLSAPVLTYLYPRFDGYGHQYALECFCIVNAGLALWALRILLGPMVEWMSVAPTLILVSAIAFMPVLVWLCVRGIGVKTWVFLVLWYASGILLFVALSSI